MTSRAKFQTRRLQLWVKQSVSNVVSSEMKFDSAEQGTSSDDRTQCRNIDEALSAFHVDEVDFDGDQRSIHKYQQEYDWILDGDSEHKAECIKSRELLRQLNYLAIDSGLSCDMVDKQDLQVPETHGNEEENFMRLKAEKHEERRGPDTETSLEDDDSCFGDFQTATTVNDRYTDTLFEDMKYKGSFDGGKLKIVPCDDLLHQDSEFSITIVDTVSDNTVDLTQIQQSANSKFLEAFKSLNLDDLASPEGKFLRRHLSESYTEGSKRRIIDESFQQDIPSSFFEDVDDSLDVLRSIPWDHMPIWKNMDDVEVIVVEDHITRQLSKLDGFQSQLTKVLLERVSELQPRLEEGNRLVHDMDINLKLAKSYANRSQEAMEAATGQEQDFTGLLGGLSLLRMWDQKDMLSDFAGILLKCAKLLEKEEHIMQQISSFGVDNNDFHQILIDAEMLRSVTSKQAEGGLSELDCLKPLHYRACTILGHFRKRIEIALQDHVAKICDSWENFSSEYYMTLLLATLEVHKHQLNQLAETEAESDKSIAIPPNVSEAWSSCILDTLAYESSKCFARALLDPPGETTDSEYDADLINLAFELKRGFGDYAKLKTVTHNLVTLRFDFEADKNYLPSVFERLCTLLTDVLHGHFVIAEWHDEFQFGTAFRKMIYEMKLPLWKCCEQVLLSCLSSYQSFATTKALFPEKDDSNSWLVDLEGLHDVLQLTNQFLSLGNEFLDIDQLADTSIDSLSTGKESSELHTKLCDIFRKHLRSVHVEAMNSMGMMLSKESWQLVPLHEPCDVRDVERMIKTELISRMAEFGKQSCKRRKWMNKFYDRGVMRACNLKSLKKSGNPFLVEALANQETRNFDVDYFSLGRSQNKMESLNKIALRSDSHLFQMMERMVDGSGLHRLATQSAAYELMKWTSRLLFISQKLPIIVDDAMQVLRSLCDLYFVTVFRLCIGNAYNERIVLGIDCVQPYIAPRNTDSTANQKGTESTFMGSFGLISPKAKRRSSLPPLISPNIVAEMCAPRLTESSTAGLLRDFIENGQANLRGIVNLDRIEKWMPDPVQSFEDDTKGDEFICNLSKVLEKRQGAAWSCLFVAALLDGVCTFVESTFTFAYLERLLGLSHDEEKKEDDCGPSKPLMGVDSLASYADSVIQVIPTLVDVASRIAAMKAILGRQVVKDISMLGPKWAASRLNEQHNEYVDELCDRYANMWQFLSTSGKLPLGVRLSTWEQLVAAGFLAILEGFARVPYCSTEGRSLMSMDIGSFTSGISPRSIADRIEDDGFDRPPAVLPSRGRSYVDTYIKVFYFPDDDVLAWIGSNYKNYHLNHCLSLIAECNGRPTNTSPGILKQSIKKMYNVS